MKHFHTTKHGSQLHYAQIIHENAPLHIIFIHGFMSDKEGAKAIAIEDYSRSHNLNYTRFDMTGHGQSSGDFTQCTISLWLEDCLSIVDNLTQKDSVILIGSSLGGWLMLLTALARKERVHGLLGIAAAPDCISELIYQPMDDKDKLSLKMGKTVMLNRGTEKDDPYPITPELIADGDNHNLLGKDIPLHCPLRLIHGDQDTSVPHHYSNQILNHIQSDDATMILIKNGDHRLSDERSLACLLHALESLIKAVKPTL